MSDIIQLLPDSVANQIAAGEVIQRPASVVKELMENAIDAGATTVKVNIKDAGKTLIQVIDNGCGMSQTDARLSFERHATSKIRKAKDLFAIKTMGFRGEALASIAAIAHVELKTRKHEDEIGTHIQIKGSKFISQENVACAAGSNFIIKDLFFNTPARRKFLRSNTTELKHILNEFYRIALSHAEMNFQLFHNDNLIFKLPNLGFKKTIIQLFGKNYTQKLLSLNVDTSIVKINGFIGTPESAKKKYGQQFFFVNNRFIKHPYLHKAVLQAYEKLIQPNHLPIYFIKLDVNPNMIDINIHPTKTVVKFEDEPSFFRILHAIVTETLGKFNFMPSIDFNEDHSINIPILKHDTIIKTPKVNINPGFNPFSKEKDPQSREISQNWEKLYDPVKIKKSENKDVLFQEEYIDFFQFKNRYILLQTKSGLMIINQKRAHIRILYEVYLKAIQNVPISSQQLLYAEKIEVAKSDYIELINYQDYLKKIGFNIDLSNDNTIIIKGIPQNQTINDVGHFFEEVMASISNPTKTDNPQKYFANSMAKISSIKYGMPLEKVEMETLFNQLFACKSHLYTPDGKKIIHIINMKEFQKFLP